MQVKKTKALLYKDEVTNLSLVQVKLSSVFLNKAMDSNHANGENIVEKRNSAKGDQLGFIVKPIVLLKQ